MLQRFPGLQGSRSKSLLSLPVFSSRRSGPLGLVGILLVLSSACAGSDNVAAELSPSASSSLVSLSSSITTSTTTTTTDVTTVASTTTVASAPNIDPPPVLREDTPPLVDIDGWLGADIRSLDELKGSVVVVEFWTFGCYNCKNRIPHTQDLYAKYQDQGMEIVGIHSPEFTYERDVANIEQAMADLGVTWPVALDTDRRTFREWQGRPAYWPRTYVLDRRGRIRFDHIGEGAYEELDQVVAYLLTDSG